MDKKIWDKEYSTQYTPLISFTKEYLIPFDCKYFISGVY